MRCVFKNLYSSLNENTAYSFPKCNSHLKSAPECNRFYLNGRELGNKKTSLKKNQPCFPLVAMGVFGHEKKWPRDYGLSSIHIPLQRLESGNHFGREWSIESMSL